MGNPEPGQPPNTANGRPYGPQGPIRYTRPVDPAAPGDDTRFYEEETPVNGPESKLSGPGFEPDRPEFGPLQDAADEAAGGPEPGQPADPGGGWPFDPEPVRFADPFAVPSDGTVAGDGIRPYGEWSQEATFTAETTGYELPRNLEPPTGWAGGGFHAPGDETRPPWGDPYPTTPPPESPRRGRRPALRPLTVAALALAVVAAGVGGALLRGKMASGPAATPSAAASAGLSAAAGGTSGTPSPQQPAAEPPAISKPDAKNVVASYSKVNNEANAAYSDSLLRTIKSGSSYTMTAGAYRFALGQSSRAAYVPFGLTGTAYYIPRLPQGSYPRWFAVEGTYATVADGKKLGPAYLVFAQDSAGAPWKDVFEPDVLPGQSPPQIATDSSGYAQSVAPDATGLNVAPGKIGQVTAEWLDQVAASKSDSVIRDESGNLTDLQDEVFWRSGQGGTAMNATDTHSAPAGQVFALRTTTGGALVFYVTAAQLTLTPANGHTISGLNIPGYYSPANSAGLTSATVGYVEQFATYIPPAGSNARDVVADISSIASRG